MDLELLLRSLLLGVITQLVDACHLLCECDESRRTFSCKDITLSPSDLTTLTLPPWTREVTLTNNNISTISKDLLHPFRGVKKLRITNNLLTSIPPGTFQDFSNLTMLVLNNNNIKELQGKEFTGLNNLLSLELAGNSISELTPGIFNELTSISSIKLSSNKLKTISNGVFTPLRTLRDLFVGKNEITELDSRAFQNMSMSKLELTSNKLTKLTRSTFANFKIKRKIMMFNNAMHCGCAQAMIYATHFRDLQRHVWAMCTSPPELAGKNILTAYAGTQCTMCDLHLCRNGAGCQGNQTHYTCMCAEQYKGIFCERNICKPEVKYVTRYVPLPGNEVKNKTKTFPDNEVDEKLTPGGFRPMVVTNQGKQVDQRQRLDPGRKYLEDENRELETRVLILYAICSIELVIILCFVGLLILGKYQDWRLMKKYSDNAHAHTDPGGLDKFQWTPASEMDNLNGNGKGYISISELVPYKI